MHKTTKQQPRKTTRTKPSPPSARDSRPCPIVGIGASSGGLEAFSQLLRQLPADTGFGFVLVQHLDPQHESALASILGRTTSMPVREVTNNLRVEANNVYIIPPNTILGIEEGVLKLLPRLHNRLASRSIDQFFESLAKDQAERAIGVILSGNATDGTLGLEAIKACGGFTFAQDKSARYDSMPRSAVAAGCVDRVLSPGKIADELARIARHPYLADLTSDAQERSTPRAKPGNAALTEDPSPRTSSVKRSRANGRPPGGPAPDADGGGIAGEAGYNEILLLLGNHTGIDFSLYKPSTLGRRIARRSVLNRKASLKAYAAFLKGNRDELDALYSDTLIGVTSFFRNPASFAALKQTVFPKLLAEGGQEPVRVWVLGCSTGQEAYSLAMAYMEVAQKFTRPRKLQIFATDLKEANLEKARTGLYPKTIGQDVSSERLERFFVEEENGYRVGKQLRELIVFARQNVMSDPPFSRMDLISCRNLMIYLEPGLQKKMIPMFHYALKRGGFLFLGASESVGGFGELFAAVSKKHKLFVRNVAPTRAFQIPVKQGGREPFARALTLVQPRPLPGSNGSAKEPPVGEISAEREADRVILNKFAPPGVLIGPDFQVLQFRGRTGAFLEAPAGKATLDVLRMAREGLMLPLRAAITSASRQHSVVRREGIRIKHGGRTRSVAIEVVPLRNLRERCFLVLFEESGHNGAEQANGDPMPLTRAPSRSKKSEDSSRVAGLERDLSEAREYLQSVQERQETANQELQASNEEGQSANEELQSLNEELETSKEELESTNEELTTVNDEMVSRNAELNRMIEERKKHEEALRKSEERFRALFELGPVAVYTCDKAGHVIEFNRCARELWGRTPKTGDSGEKYCGSFKLHYPDGSLMPHSKCPMALVLKGKIPEARDLEAIIERPDGSQINIVVNIVPLKKEFGETTGAINCFYDVTERKRSEMALGAAREELAKYVGRLETLVLARTANLREANEKLQASNKEVIKSREEYRVLFADSLVMQEKLRHLTRLTMSAQEEERKKISRELHDEVVQTLIGIGIELSALRNAGLADERIQGKVADIQQLVEDTVTAVHGFARGLRPAVLDDLGLVPALQLICKGLRTKKKLKIQISASGAVEEIKSEGRIVLFRIAQEALNNVSRHANASKVLVSVGKLGQVIRLEITDNGKSFDAGRMLSDRNPKRLGLVGMRERLETIGGTLNIESAKGKGTVVRAEIPVVLDIFKNEASG